MVLEFSVPAAVVGLMWVSIYRGNSPLSLALVILDTLLAPFLIPLTLRLLVGSQVAIDTSRMMEELIFMIALPALLAMVLNQLSRDRVKETWPARLAPYSKFCLIFVVTANSSEVAPYIRHLNAQRLLAAGCILLLATCGYVIGWLLALLFRQPHDITVSMIYGAGYAQHQRRGRHRLHLLSGGGGVPRHDRHAVPADSGRPLRHAVRPQLAQIKRTSGSAGGPFGLCGYQASSRKSPARSMVGAQGVQMGALHAVGGVHAGADEGCPAVHAGPPGGAHVGAVVGGRCPPRSPRRGPWQGSPGG